MSRYRRLNPRTLERSTLDPHTLRPKYPRLGPAPWDLDANRPSRYLLLGDSDPSTARAHTSQPPGEWVERSSTHPTSGRRIHWKERTIGDGGTIERFYLNPAISER